MRPRLPMLTAFLAGLLIASSASATIPSGSDNTDGVLNVTSANLVIDLSQAVKRPWNAPSTGAGSYDSTKWAVVFKYSSVDIAAGRTVTFTNHPSGAPVVWLVSNDVTIAGSVVLDGEGFTQSNRESVPGPGGFPGGRGLFTGSPGTAGSGPGGGAYNLGASLTRASYGSVGIGSSSPIYGNSRILPLIGGSGGGGDDNITSGGAGGGAILIIAGRKLTLTGGIYARGGGAGNASGDGSGGAIRVIADTLAGNGAMHAYGGRSAGGNGRVRLETNVLTYTNQSAPAYSLLLPLGAGGVVTWPPAPEPTVRIATVNNQAVTADPRMNPSALVGGDITISTTSAVPLTLAASNVPTTSTVTVRVVLGGGNAYTVPATFQSGNLTSSTWTATLTSLTPARVSSMQAKVVLH